MTEDRRQKKVLFFISGALVIMTVIAYEPVRHNKFVSYDDNRYITENPDIKAGVTRETIGLVFKPHYFMWHPLTTFTNMVDCEIFGLNPAGHHIVSVSIHIVSSLLLFWILANLTKSVWASAFAAAVFAVHPVQVESVAWAAERKTVLSGLFWFLTIAVYIWYAKRPNIRRYILLFLVYCLCIMTKPTVVTLPLVLLLLDYWPLGRFGGVNPALQLKRLFAEKIPLLVLAGFLSVMTVIAQKGGEVVVTLEQMPLGSRIANMFLSYTRYIGKALWPSDLAVIYPMPAPAFLKSTALICIPLIILITFACIYFGRRRRYVATGWLWYVGTLVPVIGLVQSGSQAMANRYMYLTILGLLIIIAWSVKEFIASRPGLKTVTAAAAGGVLLALIILTRMQVGHWETSASLFDYALKVTKNNAIAENSYGCAMFYEGRFDEAVEHLSRAIRIHPKYFEPGNNLGKVLLRQGRFNEAIACFNGVLKLKPEEAEAYANLGVAYSQLGKNDEAVKNWTKAMQLNPDNAEVLNNMAWVLATAGEVTKGDIARAIELAQRACKITRNKEADPLDTLSVAYAAAGRFAEAAATAEKALKEAKEAGREDLAGEIKKRLDSYKAGRPYRGK